MNQRRAKVWLGSALLLGAMLTLLLALVSPGFAQPAARVGATLWSGLDAAREGDVVLPVDTLSGVHVGAPVYFLSTGHERAPVAHVVAPITRADGSLAVQLRFAPGAASDGPWVLRVHPPRRGLADSFRLAVPPSTARKVGTVLRERLDTLWRDQLGPSLAERLPEFLARIDPRNDGTSQDLLAQIGDTAMAQLRPLMDDLLNNITRALEKRFDFLDRMGVLWKFVRGDARGLKRKVQPVAEQAARAWWDAHQDEVLTALGHTFEASLPAIRRWVETEVLEAARRELLEPIIEEHKERLEDEGEALMRIAVQEVVESDEGGFRVRFAAMLRMTLLGKKRALLLLERPAKGHEGE